MMQSAFRRAAFVARQNRQQANFSGLVGARNFSSTTIKLVRGTFPNYSHDLFYNKGRIQCPFLFSIARDHGRA